MKSKTKKNLHRNLIITQISIYIFIIAHAILWHVFGLHFLTKLCPFSFASHVGSLEFNFTVVFWILVLASTLFFGRAFCAWGCMFGAYQDFVARIFAKLKIKPLKNKYAIWLLRIIVFALFVGIVASNNIYWPTFFWYTVITISIGILLWGVVEKKPSAQNLIALPKYVYFAQYLGGIVAMWITLNVFQKGVSFAFEKFGVLENEPWASLITLAVLVAIGIGAVEKRVFCKYLCPIGLLLRFFSAIPFRNRYKVRATGEKCTQCRKCNRECLMGIKPMEETLEYGVVKDPNCINCLMCVSKCPQNAIDFINMSSAEITGRQEQSKIAAANSKADA